MRLFAGWNYDGGSRIPAGYLRAICNRSGFLARAAAALVLLAAAVLGTHTPAVQTLGRILRRRTTTEAATPPMIKPMVTPTIGHGPCETSQ